MAEVTDKKTAWAVAKDALVAALGFGMDDAAWAEMGQAVKDSGSEMPTEESERKLFESFLLHFEGQGIAPRQAREMAKEATKGHEPSWPLRG